MTHCYSSWSKKAQTHSEILKVLPIRTSVAIEKIQCSYPSNEYLACPLGMSAKKLTLQLRENYFVVIENENDLIVDFFECEPQIFVLIKEISKEQNITNQEQNNIGKRHIMIKFSHKKLENQYITFYCDVDQQKLIELYRTLPKTNTIQLDFHQLFKPIRKIGQGLTSTVYQALRHADKQLVAVKAFKKSAYFAMANGKGQKAFLREFKILSGCDHQSICRFEGVYQTQNTIYIVQEYYQKSLSSLVMKQEVIPRNQVLRIMQELIGGVHYLHSKGIFHRDIKLQNIMLRLENNSYKSVIIDLGMADYINEQFLLFQKCGTPGYVAPQVFTKGAKHPKCDIFSLGVIFYILLFKAPVFLGESKEELMSNNRHGKMGIDLQKINAEGELIKDLLLRMLELNQDNRINSFDALRHPLFQGKKGPSTPQTIVSIEQLNFPEEIDFNYKNQIKQQE